MRHRNLAKQALLCGAVTAIAGACGEVPVDSENFKAQGNFKGSVQYTGPLPCTQRVHDPTTGADVIHVVGSANILVFDEDLLPPPEGFGTTAKQLGVVPGDVLFSSVASMLPIPPPGVVANGTDDPTGTVACPPAGTQVTVSASWTIGPLPAGRYQVRGFYDYEGSFSPVVKLHQLPNAGDIGGGALANAEEVVAGKPARFASFQLGADLDGTGRIAIDSRTGALVEGIAVILAQPLAYTRPIFNYGEVLDVRPGEWTETAQGAGACSPTACPVPDGLPAGVTIGCVDVTTAQPAIVCGDGQPPTPGTCASCTTGTCTPFTVNASDPPGHLCTKHIATTPPAKQTDPNALTLSRDERFLIGVSDPKNAAVAHEHFLRVRLRAGLPDAEQARGAAAPYFLQGAPPLAKLWLYANTDANGVVKGIPESPKGLTVTDMFPQAIFAKLDTNADGRNQTAQSAPAVILQGINLTDGNAKEGKFGTLLAGNALKTPRAADYVDIALRPTAICLDPFDVNATVYVVTPELKAFNGDVLVDPVVLIPKLVAQLGNRPHIKLVKGCLPRGAYQGNLVYNTGQAWTLPNEAGSCMPLELPGAGDTCTQNGATRTLLASQAPILRIDGERETGYCDGVKPDPSAPELTYLHGVPTVCLRQDEIDAAK